MYNLDDIKQIKVIKDRTGYSRPSGKNVWLEVGANIDKDVVEKGLITLETVQALEKLGTVEVILHSKAKIEEEPKMSPDDKKLKGSKKKNKEVI